MDALVLEEVRLQKALIEQVRKLLREKLDLEAQVESLSDILAEKDHQIHDLEAELVNQGENIEKGATRMNRICYYKENRETKMEWQQVTKVTEEEAKSKFKVKDKPAYLQIFFHRALVADELFDIYAVLIEHGIIDMAREKMDEAIAEDLKHQPMGPWEMKCEFQNAMSCAVRLAGDILFHERAFTFQISDEPTEWMTKWLKKKDAEKAICKKVDSWAETFDIADFDVMEYHTDEPDVTIKTSDKRREMGHINNLIRAMVKKGATKDEIADIVKYSMVVIDAEKKQLNWRQAAIDFNVKLMQEKYMSTADDV